MQYNSSKLFSMYKKIVNNIKLFLLVLKTAVEFFRRTVNLNCSRSYVYQHSII